MPFDREGKSTTDPVAFGESLKRLSSSLVLSNTTTPTATTIAQHSASRSSTKYSSSEEAVDGASVGAILGVAFLVSLAFIWYQFRSKKSLERKLQETKAANEWQRPPYHEVQSMYSQHQKYEPSSVAAFVSAREEAPAPMATLASTRGPLHHELSNEIGMAELGYRERQELAILEIGYYLKGAGHDAAIPEESSVMCYDNDAGAGLHALDLEIGTGLQCIHRLFERWVSSRKKANFGTRRTMSSFSTNLHWCDHGLVDMIISLLSRLTFFINVSATSKRQHGCSLPSHRLLPRFWACECSV